MTASWIITSILLVLCVLVGYAGLQLGYATGDVFGAWISGGLAFAPLAVIVGRVSTWRI